MSSYLVLIALGLVVLTWFIVGSIFSAANNATTTTPTTTTTAKRTGLDFDSEEDEGLFGKQEKSGLLNNLRQPAKSKGSPSNTLSGGPDTLPPSGPSKSSGVENVRAMPDAISSIVSGPSKSRKRESNLFGSDSEDEGDLFASKPALPGKVTTSASQGQGKAQLTNSSGLFSSDEDSLFFSGPSPIQVSKDGKKNDDESPSQTKESGRKVPIGGVSIFGAAITSALRRHRSSGEESSDDDDKKPNASSTREPIPHPSKPDDKFHPKTSNPIKRHANSGLFDSDDENLFDTLVTKPVCVSSDADKTHSNTVPSLSESNTKASEEKGIIDNESPNLVGKNRIAKSTAGLFSDDDDDLFGIPTTIKNEDVSVPETQAPITDKSPGKVTAASSRTEAVSEASRPPPLFMAPPDIQTPSDPVNISEPPKTSNSLFSSPSDDDDDIFSSIPRSVHKAHHTSAFVTEPPPLPPQSTTSQTTQSLRKGPTLSGVHVNLNNDKSTKVTFDGDSKEISSNLFHSPSDEDIFSPFIPPETPQMVSVPIVTTKTEKTEPSIEEPRLSIKSVATESSKSTGPSAKEVSGVFDSHDHDIFKSVPQTPGNNSKEGAVVHQDSLSDGLSHSSKENKDVGVVIKENNLFASTDDDLFGITERSDEANGSSKNNDDSSLACKTKPQTNDETPGVSVNTATLKSPEDPTPLNEGISVPVSPSSSQCKPSLAGTHKPKEGVVKPPVGGVALFGGKELAAQINKCKNLLEPPEDENKQPTEKIIVVVHDFVSEGDDQSKTVIFDENSDDDIFGVNVENSKKQSTSSLFHRQSPPLFPEEVENNLFSIKQEPPIIQEKYEGKLSNLDDDLRTPSDTDTNQKKTKPHKCEDAVEEEEENKEIKPRRKPPTGGVSIFGGGGMGGSELLAKVMQRKSMLACESDSSEEDTPTGPTETTKPSVPQDKKGMTVCKSVMPASLVPPLSTSPPVLAPALRRSQSGGEDGSISFDDPALQSDVLQSLNKTRARGSLKRRPPSRAHRKKSANCSDPSDTADTSSTTQTSPTIPSNLEHQHTTVADITKIEPSQPAERLQHPPTVNDQRKVPVSPEPKEVEFSSTNTKTGTSSKGSDSVEHIIEPVGVSHEKNEKGMPPDVQNVSEAAESALDTSEAKNGSQTRSDSLFGGSDSDDDIFGEAKQKQGVRKPLASSGVAGIPKIAGKNSKSYSLFEDNDDEASIFSSKKQVNKITAGASRNVTITKTKGNLKQSSEPFEDPLLGNLKN